MACKAGHLFRGLGTVVANMPGGLDRCNPLPMPLVMINGSDDPLEPDQGGKVGWISGGGTLWSVGLPPSHVAAAPICGHDRGPRR